LRTKVLISLLIGASAGMLAGLTGVGGGVFLVPLMVGLLAMVQHQAHGTSFLVILPIAIVGAITYGILGHIDDWPLLVGLVSGGAVGVLLGARLMMLLPERHLKWLFGAFLVFVGFAMIITYTSAPTADASSIVLSWGFILSAIGIGFVAGILAGMMGVGGGVVMVPGMVLLLGVGQHTAQGVSLAAIAVKALLGALAHYRQGNVKPRMALLIIPAAAISCLLGSVVADQLDAAVLRQLVGGVIIIVGFFMAIKDWRTQKDIPLESWLANRGRVVEGNVLVVDDDPGIREMLGEVILRKGYKVVTVESGELALEEMEKQHFGLVFLDLVLPGMSGAEAFSAIKQKDKKAVVVIVTGYDEDPLAVEAMSHGPLFLIRKPFRISAVAEVLDAVGLR